MESNNIDLKEYQPALFNTNKEEKCNNPELAVKMAKKFYGADMVFIVSPEYGGFLSPFGHCWFCP